MGKLVTILFVIAGISVIFPTATGALMGLLIAVGTFYSFFPGFMDTCIDFFDRPWLHKYVGNKYLTVALLLCYPCLWGFAYLELPSEAIEDGFIQMVSGPAEEQQPVASWNAQDINPPSSQQELALSRLTEAPALCDQVCSAIEGKFVGLNMAADGEVSCTCNVGDKALKVALPR